ncbi:TolC family protein [Alienimonas californiensis]|uniref:Outer membrane efflux protein n=1 Tax=Alienimonas californiensis TaxID=2527989 RepID=A0A517PBE4_9PLAN|nr:TolC family protein [Alienimonas californiensis]QDT16687.1 Outer membrane efflux protein [Alienimonas californiensis]
MRPVSFQDESGGDAANGIERGEFYDPLLDVPTEKAPSERAPAQDPSVRQDGNGSFDPLLDAPAPDDGGDPANGEPRSHTAGAAAGPPTIGLEAAAALAVARSPRAAAARRRADSIAARLPQVTALEDPTLTSTSYPIRDQALQTAAGRVQTGVQVAQRFPWLAKLDARGEVVRREAQVALTEAATAELAAALAARTAWFEAWYAGRAVEVTERNRDLLEQLSDVAVARVRTGGAQTDVLRTQLEIDRLDDRLLQLTQAEDLARADLAAVLRLPPGAALPTATTELPPLDAAAEVDVLSAAAQRCRPELQRIGWEIARDRAERRVACLAGKPDFTAGFGYAVVTEEDALAGNANGRDNVSVLFGLTLPIYGDKIRAGVAEADRRLAADARSLDAERDETLRLIRRLAIRLDSLADQLDLLETRILPRAERTLEVSLADYRGERVGFTEAASSYADILRLEVQRARLRADVGIALAELERAVGCDLATTRPVPSPAPAPAPLPETLQAPPPIPSVEEPRGDGPAAAAPAEAIVDEPAAVEAPSEP